jgi:hypothetical protein
MRAWMLVLLLACDREAGFIFHDLSESHLGSDLSCVDFAGASRLVPVSLLFLVDRSAAMDPATRWQPVAAGLEAFFADPASQGISASLHLLPADDVCTADAYAIPVVGMRTLPDLSFAPMLDGAVPMGTTPTEKALTGVLKLAQQTLAMDPSSRVAVVFITGSDPNDCGSTADGAAMTLSAAAAAIPTFVIAVGQGLTSPAQLAQAGGTGSPTLLDVGDPAMTRMQLINALDAVRGLVLSCELALPPTPPGLVIDAMRVNVTFTPSTGGEGQILSYDPDCNGAGWRWNDVAAPTGVVLCPPTCAAARSDGNGVLEVLFGCDTVGR